MSREVAVSFGTQIVLGADATNPGGVWDLAMSGGPRGQRPFQVVQYGPDRWYRDRPSVPETLSIFGFPDGEPILITIDRTADVDVGASNYNGQGRGFRVTYVPYRALVADLAADKQIVAPGEPFTVTWNTQWAREVEDPFGLRRPTGSITVEAGIQDDTPFGLWAWNGLEQITRGIVVRVSRPSPQPQPPDIDLRVSARQIDRGRTIAVTWTTSSGSNCTPTFRLRSEQFDRPRGELWSRPVAASGMLPDTPSESVNYFLKATCNEGGSNEQQISVAVIGPRPTLMQCCYKILTAPSPAGRQCHERMFAVQNCSEAEAMLRDEYGPDADIKSESCEEFGHQCPQLRVIRRPVPAPQKSP